MAPAAIPLLSSEGGLARYLDEIKRFPMLAPQQEFMLAKRWCEHGDSEAAHRLVTSHLHLVAKIAMGFRGYGLPMSEVVSEGNIGLMRAVKRFEPECGFRLETYATWWARASIQEYILRSWSLVKMGTAADQKKLFLNLQLARSCITALEDGDLQPDQIKQIATQAGAIERDVVESNHRLNTPSIEPDNGGWYEWPGSEKSSQKHRVVDIQTIPNIYDLTSRIILKQIRAAYSL